MRLDPPERSWRLVLRGLWPRLWRRPAEYDLYPLAVLRSRLAAARLVFNLGMTYQLQFYGYLSQGARFENHVPARGGPHRVSTTFCDHFFFGENTMTICRPSISAFCSTTAISARSPDTRCRSRRPISWCAISRPRKRSVTLALSPSVRKRVRLRSLTW